MQITEAESAVMDVLWHKHPLAADEIAVELARTRDWQDATVKTLLNRLLTKGAVQADRDGRRYLYSPLIARDHWVLEESQGLLKRLFGGRVAPLVAHFSAHRKLSKKDIAELRQLLDRLEDQAR